MKTYARKGLRMSPDLARWYEEKAMEMGITQNALMVMALNEYAKQENVALVLSELKRLLNSADSVKG